MGRALKTFLGLALPGLLSGGVVAAETQRIVLFDKDPFTIPGPTITIERGDTVEWFNPPREGGALHTVTQEGCITGEACEFDSDPLQPGDRFRRTFTEPGVYPYRCRQHALMRGTIIVNENKK